MKNMMKWALALMFLPFAGIAQEAAEKTKLVELIYINVKMGSEEKFESAVLAHNKKYHASGPYSASLYYIETGEEAGTYVWSMGTFTYSEKDGSPGAGEHQKDWAKTIQPYIESYGRTEIWSYRKKLSSAKEGTYAIEEIWFLDIEGDEYYRFKGFMTKIQKIMADQGEPMYVYGNEFGQDNGRDMALVFPMANWAAYDKEDWNMKEAFEKEYGPNSWTEAMEEWEDTVESMSREVWSEIE